MKKIMLSHGMRGKENVEQYVSDCRTAVKNYYLERGEEIEIIDTYFKDFDGNRLRFLGKSISDGLALADELVFMDDWINYDGCCCEYFIAETYGIPCIQLASV